MTFEGLGSVGLNNVHSHGNQYQEDTCLLVLQDASWHRGKDLASFALPFFNQYFRKDHTISYLQCQWHGVVSPPHFDGITLLEIPFFQSSAEYITEKILSQSGWNPPLCGLNTHTTSILASLMGRDSLSRGDLSPSALSMSACRNHVFICAFARRLALCLWLGL